MPHGMLYYPNSTVFGACLGSDDSVDLSITVNLKAKNTMTDIGMYIAVDGGNAMEGDCIVSLLANGTYTSGADSVTIGDNDGNSCPDVTSVSGSGLLEDYLLSNLIFQCQDSDNDYLLE